MVSKFICVALFIAVVATMILSTTNMHDPLFMFLSDNPITGGIRLAIVASLLAMSFSNRVLKPPFRVVLKAFSIFLGVFGLVTLFTNSMGWALYNYVMPLDSILMIEAGIMFGLAILSTAEPSTEPTKDLFQSLQNLQLRINT